MIDVATLAGLNLLSALSAAVLSAASSALDS
jgi:hypothetical protein